VEEKILLKWWRSTRQSNRGLWSRCNLT
jgi:hypothetical protein